MTPTDLGGSDLSSLAQVILGLATLVNGLLLWPVVKKLQRNDERQDVRLDSLETKKRKRVRK